jgi:A/G-specific adenine glycosylase
MLAIQHGADILLEKRPAPGIWGGLWCLPEIGMQSEADNMCLSLTGLVPTRIDPLPRFAHTFTHFRLHIQPQAITLAHSPHQLTEPGAIWMPVADAVHAAVPKPVKRILQMLIRE